MPNRQQSEEVEELRQGQQSKQERYGSKGWRGL